MPLFSFLAGCGLTLPGIEADSKKAYSACEVSQVSPADGSSASDASPTFVWDGTCQNYALELTIPTDMGTGTFSMNVVGESMTVESSIWDRVDAMATLDLVTWRVIGNMGKGNKYTTTDLWSLDLSAPTEDTGPPADTGDTDPPDDTTPPVDTGDPVEGDDPPPDPDCDPPAEPSAPPAPSDCTSANSCRVITSCNVSWSSSVKFYYLGANIISYDDDCLVPTVDDVTIYGDGTKTVTADGDWVDSIRIYNRTGVVVDGVVSPSISIEGGERNRVRNSTFGYAGISHSSNNVFEDNLIETDDGRALQVGDISDVDTFDNSECNVVSDNVIRSADGVNDRFVVIDYVYDLTFDGNTVELLNVSAPAGDKPLLFTCYTCMDSRILDNTFTIDIDDSIHPDTGGYRGGAVILRSGAMRNEVGGNIVNSDVYRGIWQQSSGGFEHPADNWYHDNVVWDWGWSVAIQAMSIGSNQTRFENNVMYAKNHVALDLAGVVTGASVAISGNTIVAADGDAVWADGTTTSGRELVLRDNIIDGVGGKAMSLGLFDVDDDYNLYWSTTGTAIQTPSGSWSSATSWPEHGSHTKYADPKFKNPAAKDLSLQSTSPAIGAGQGGVDMGAIPYEP